ncbi:MAG: TM2 domain-containing protein [bacterium]
MNEKSKSRDISVNNSAKDRSKLVGVLLALCFGGLGLHHSYIGRDKTAMIYAFFVWTGVPAFLGLIEAFFMPARVSNFNHNYEKAKQLNVITVLKYPFFGLASAFILWMIFGLFMGLLGELGIGRQSGGTEFSNPVAEADLYEFSEDQKQIISLFGRLREDKVKVLRDGYFFSDIVTEKDMKILEELKSQNYFEQNFQLQDYFEIRTEPKKRIRELQGWLKSNKDLPKQVRDQTKQRLKNAKVEPAYVIQYLLKGEETEDILLFEVGKRENQSSWKITGISTKNKKISSPTMSRGVNIKNK